jgi:spore coat protein A, manganese oxidase
MKQTNKFTRREFVKRTAVAGAGVALLSKFAVPSARAINTSPGLTKWMQPLRGLNYPAGHLLGALGYPKDPNGIPVAMGSVDPGLAKTTMYEIGIQEFSEKLHPNLGPTKLWGYVDISAGGLKDGSGFPLARHLGGLVVAVRPNAAAGALGSASRLRFTNNLPSRHILPVDITLPGANLAQNRVAVHLHGGFIPWLCDGGPFDWWTPGCESYATGQSFQNGPSSIFDNTGTPMGQGQADYYYGNDQSTRLMWYHDHAFGITRLNAYAGIATGYLCVDLANDTARLTVNSPGTGSVIPLVWQEKSFVWGNDGTNGLPVTGTFLTDPTWADISRPDVQTPGSLWYEHTYNPKLFKLATGGLPIVEPSIIPEFFGDTMLCNGLVFPLLQNLGLKVDKATGLPLVPNVVETIEPKAYRFMLLNATNARFLNINTFVADATADGITLNAKTQFPANLPGPAMTQIGNEAGYLAADVKYGVDATGTVRTAFPFNPATMGGNLILGPAERADVIIDFSAFAGKDIILYNDAPAPFPGGAPTNDYYIGNAKNPAMAAAVPGSGPDTRQILRIRVAATRSDGLPIAANNGPFLNGSALDPAPIVPLTMPPASTVLTGQTAVPVQTIPITTVINGTKNLTLNEAFDRWGRLIQELGTTAPQLAGGFGQPYLNPPTEVVTAPGNVEVWNIFNTTADTHPMHFHLINAQVLSRQPFKMVKGLLTVSGVARGPDANELGWKETIKMHPGEVIQILMKFDLPADPVPLAGKPAITIPSSQRMDTAAASPATAGFLIPGKKHHEYVWHCHILEHEEHDMMRPLVVEQTPPPLGAAAL